MRVECDGMVIQGGKCVTALPPVEEETSVVSKLEVQQNGEISYDIDLMMTYTKSCR